MKVKVAGFRNKKYDFEHLMIFPFECADEDHERVTEWTEIDLEMLPVKQECLTSNKLRNAILVSACLWVVIVMLVNF